MAFKKGGQLSPTGSSCCQPVDFRCVLGCTDSQLEFIANHDTFGQHMVVTCSECGLIFTVPPVLDDELRELYSTEYWQRRCIKHSGPDIDPGPTARTMAQTKFILQTLSVTSLAGWRVLDVGCGSGNLLASLKNLGASAWGVEPDPLLGRYAQEAYGVVVKVGLVGEIDLPAQHFDLICMSHVLEHLADPLPALSKLRQVARPGGAMFVEVPHHPRTDFDIGRQQGPHLSFFTPETMNRVALCAGFEVIRTSTCGLSRSEYVQERVGRQVQSPSFPYRLYHKIDSAARSENAVARLSLRGLQPLRWLYKRAVHRDVAVLRLDETCHETYYDDVAEHGQWIRTLWRATYGY